MTNLGSTQWQKFRVVDAGYCTLRELENDWSIVDFADALEYLDIKDEADRYFAEKEKRKR